MPKPGMVEQVKKAVRNEWGSRLCNLDAFAKRPCESGSACACLDVARAAIEAMREPTAAMIKAGTYPAGGAPEAEATWEAMAKAALEEGK